MGEIKNPAHEVVEKNAKVCTDAFNDYLKHHPEISNRNKIMKLEKQIKNVKERIAGIE